MRPQPTRKITLEEASDHRYYTITCKHAECRRSVSIAGLLAEHFPQYRTRRIDELEARMRCSACGHRGALIMAASPPLGFFK